MELIYCRRNYSAVMLLVYSNVWKNLNEKSDDFLAISTISLLCINSVKNFNCVPNFKVKCIQNIEVRSGALKLLGAFPSLANG